MMESLSGKSYLAFCLFQIFLSEIVKLPWDLFDDNTSCFKSRLRSHPTSLCLVALAASDLVFCVYNLPLTAYQVTPHLCINNSWKRFFLSVFFFVWTLEEDHFSQYFSLYQLLKKTISLSIFIVAVTIPVWIGGSVCMSVYLLQKHFRIWFYMFEFQLYSFLLLWKHWSLLIHHDPHRCTSGSWRLLWTHHQQILYKGNIFISRLQRSVVAWWLWLISTVLQDNDPDSGNEPEALSYNRSS